MTGPIEVKENKGDVIGVGVDGSGNFIAKEINISINQVFVECGLRLLTKRYFEERTDTTENFKEWLKGFSFSLSSIYQDKEFRRHDIISAIYEKLTANNRLLLLGESGMSKSILLMEMMCDYLRQGYKVLYNVFPEDGDIKNTDYIVNIIVNLVDNGYNVIIVIDNVHSKNVSLIFPVIDNLKDLDIQRRKKIKFLLAARIPEYDWLLDRNLLGDTRITQIIESLFGKYYSGHENKYNENKFIYKVPFFSEEEVKGFIEKYKEYARLSEYGNSIDISAKEIYKLSDGHPIMVKFFVLQDGLQRHVKSTYDTYMVEGGRPNTDRIKAFIICALFDISSQKLSSEILQRQSLENIALGLDNTMIKKSENVWKTIHPRWDLEMFRQLFYNIGNKLDSDLIKRCFAELVNDLLLLDNKSHSIPHRIINLFSRRQRPNSMTIILFAIIDTVYSTIARGKFIPIGILEETLGYEKIEDKLDDNSKYEFITYTLGPTWLCRNHITTTNFTYLCML